MELHPLLISPFKGRETDPCPLRGKARKGERDSIIYWYKSLKTIPPSAAHTIYATRNCYR